MTPETVYAALALSLKDGGMLKEKTLLNALAFTGESAARLLVDLHASEHAPSLFEPGKLCGACGRGVVRVRSSARRTNGTTRQTLECPECGRRKGRTTSYNGRGTETVAHDTVEYTNNGGESHD
jgi:hypothetical protein